MYIMKNLMNMSLYYYNVSHVSNNNNKTAGADDGIEEIEGGGVILKCLQTRTGIKFVLTWVYYYYDITCTICTSFRSWKNLTYMKWFWMNILCRAEPGTPDLDSVLREIYVLYSDCALVRWKCVKKNVISLAMFHLK